MILWRNSLVLALHAFACVAGFIAGASLPLSASKRSGLSRWVHEKARPIALAWVVMVTCFSLVTQTYILGSDGSTLAAQLGISPGTLVLTVIPHALPELVALFLPLAAWTIAGRRDEWNQLLAATFATTAIAIPDPGRLRELGGLRVAAHPRAGLAGLAEPSTAAASSPSSVRRKTRFSSSKRKPQRCFRSSSVRRLVSSDVVARQPGDPSRQLGAPVRRRPLWETSRTIPSFLASGAWTVRPVRHSSWATVAGRTARAAA